MPSTYYDGFFFKFFPLLSLQVYATITIWRVLTSYTIHNSILSKEARNKKEIISIRWYLIWEGNGNFLLNTVYIQKW
jgi:hypothetical protein